jgi:hypothetical protein
VSIDDEFNKADSEAGVVNGMEVLAPSKSNSLSLPPTTDLLKFRKQLVEQYHQGAPSLIARLKSAGKEDLESQIVAMVDEILSETDNLLGNQLVATHNGDLRDASVISFKRAEVLEKALKAVQTRQQFEKQSGIDLDSPSMIIVFRYFMAKARDTFTRMGVGPEINDLFFRVFGEVTNEWKKELRDSFDATRTPR